jgi:hypothetical protein
MGQESTDEGKVESKEEETPIIVPVHTCYIVMRDIPLTLKAQLVELKYERGWKSWADMAYDVVREWGKGQ